MTLTLARISENSQGLGVSVVLVAGASVVTLTLAWISENSQGLGVLVVLVAGASVVTLTLARISENSQGLGVLVVLVAGASAVIAVLAVADIRKLTRSGCIGSVRSWSISSNSSVSCGRHQKAHKAWMYW